MAMTKAEKAKMDELESALRLAKALRWTSPVEPDIAVPETGMSKGFLFNEHVDYGGKGEAVVACSSSVSHSYGRNDQTTSQRPRRLYSSKLLALRAMRHVMELKYAEVLADVDRRIEQLQKESSSAPAPVHQNQTPLPSLQPVH